MSFILVAVCGLQAVALGGPRQANSSEIDSTLSILDRKFDQVCEDSTRYEAIIAMNYALVWGERIQNSLYDATFPYALMYQEGSSDHKAFLAGAAAAFEYTVEMEIVLELADDESSTVGKRKQDWQEHCRTWALYMMHFNSNLREFMKVSAEIPLPTLPDNTSNASSE